jgi:signal transduction histidine kinase
MTQALPDNYSALYPDSAAAAPLDAPRRDLLELAAGGAPIDVALNAVVRTAAQVRTQDTRAAIFILDPAGAKLRFAASAGLSKGYTSKIDHFPLGPAQPSCGKAAYTGQDVIVGDVALDAAWAPLLDLALEHGIAACWSFLLKGADGRVVGTFALYHRVPCVPDAADIAEVRYFVNIASLMIDRHVQAETLLHAQQAREAALQAANREKDVFIATLAHELRNPIAAMSNALAVLRVGGDQLATRERALGGAARQLSQMAQLIEDLLDVNRLERGQLALRQVDMALASALALAVETVMPMIDQKRQVLTVTVPPHPLELRGDPVRMTQMIGNLLGNASRYSTAGASIALDAMLEGADVVVRVRDDGIGIAEEHLGTVFSMFAQVNGANQGLGIGLHLVKQLAEMHGGSVTAHSAGVGTGATFVLRLPA